MSGNSRGRLAVDNASHRRRAESPIMTGDAGLVAYQAAAYQSHTLDFAAACSSDMREPAEGPWTHWVGCYILPACAGFGEFLGVRLGEGCAAREVPRGSRLDHRHPRRSRCRWRVQERSSMPTASRC